MRITSLPPLMPNKASMAPKSSALQENTQKQETVQLSEEGLELSRSLAEMHAAPPEMTEQEIREKYQRLWGPNSFDQPLAEKIYREGISADFTPENPDDFSPEQLARIKQATQYMQFRLSVGPSAPGPFASATRNELAAIFEDESGKYTDIERIAAHYQASVIDFNNVGIACTSGSDARPVLKYYGEFLQQLSPVERLNYPQGEEERVAHELMVMEREYGKLPEGFNIWEWLSAHEHDTEASIDTQASTTLGQAGAAPSKLPIEYLNIWDWLKKFETPPEQDPETQPLLQPEDLPPPETPPTL